MSCPSRARRGRIKHRIYAEQAGVCWLCDRRMTFDDATRDHIIPSSKGGSNAQSNLRLAHRLCNRLRSSHDEATSREYVQAKLKNWKLRRKLSAPLPKFPIAELVQDEE